MAKWHTVRPRRRDGSRSTTAGTRHPLRLRHLPFDWLGYPRRLGHQHLHSCGAQPAPRGHAFGGRRTRHLRDMRICLLVGHQEGGEQRRPAERAAGAVVRHLRPRTRLLPSARTGNRAGDLPPACARSGRAPGDPPCRRPRRCARRPARDRTADRVARSGAVVLPPQHDVVHRFAVEHRRLGVRPPDTRRALGQPALLSLRHRVRSRRHHPCRRLPGAVGRRRERGRPVRPLDRRAPDRRRRHRAVPPARSQ